MIVFDPAWEYYSPEEDPETEYAPDTTGLTFHRRRAKTLLGDCKTCRRPIVSDVDNQARSYCSPSCYHESMRTKRSTCKSCGKIFRPPSYNRRRVSCETCVPSRSKSP